MNSINIFYPRPPGPYDRDCGGTKTDLCWFQVIREWIAAVWSRPTNCNCFTKFIQAAEPLCRLLLRSTKVLLKLNRWPEADWLFTACHEIEHAYLFGINGGLTKNCTAWSALAMAHIFHFRVLGVLGVHVHLLILNCMCRHILDVAVRPIPTEKIGRCKIQHDKTKRHGLTIQISLWYCESSVFFETSKSERK